MTFRSRKEEISYRKHQANKTTDECPFCALKAHDGQVVRETEHFWVAKNIFPYAIWEGLDVDGHLMIVPKKHVDAMIRFSADELLEHANLVAQYDSDGYSTYSRSVHNKSKSIVHQHTHLLKLSAHHAKITFYLQKPYILWHR